MNQKGRFYEEVALQFFKKQGFTLVSKNTPVAGVEMDLVLKSQNGYLLVEVKSHNSWRYDHPMSQRQKQRLKQAFLWFCEQHKDPVELKLALVKKNRQVEVFPLEF